MKLEPRALMLLAAMVVLGMADQALAWGPAAHVNLATNVLENLGLLPAAVAAILARRGSSYIFGNIAADVVFAKRLSRVRLICHHWTTGFRLLDHARDESEQAFAYGYLSHLAADTVAHGLYVPRQLSITRTTMNFGHLYWEMRADAKMDRSNWQTLEDVTARDHEHHHAVLAEELTDTLLPYDYNRRLFDRINRFVARRYWQRCMGIWARQSRWRLPGQLLDDYFDESTWRIRSVLSDLDASPVLREDPSGTAALHQARLHRRHTRRLRRRGISTTQHQLEAADAMLPRRPSIIHAPDV